MILRHAFRTLRRSPAFAGAAVLTLALAIGANVSIFTVVYRVLLKPLPYGDSSRLLALDYGVPSVNITSGINFMTWQLYYQLADRARTLDGVAAYTRDELTLSGSGTAERIASSQATPSLAKVLRVQPALGRWFAEQEGETGAAPTAVLSHGLWARRYALDPGIVGQSIRLNGVPTQVIGVMPATFAFPVPRTEVWVAAQSTRASASFLFTLQGVARLRDGATIATARTEMTGLIADLARSRRTRGEWSPLPLPLQESIVGRVADTLWMLLRVGRSRAPRGVRQRREPVPRPVRGEAARGRGAPGARRRQTSPGALLPGRERPALACGRHRRAGHRLGRGPRRRGLRPAESSPHP